MGAIRRSLASLLFCAVACAASAAAAELIEIRVGWASFTHIQPLVDELARRHAEIFHHFGKSYTAAGIRFQGSTPQIQALAVGELEIAAFAPSSLALAISNAGLDVRIVGDVFQDGHPGYFSITFVVRADSPIKTVEDLKGRRVATNAIGSFSDSTMRTMFRKHGIADSDVTSVEANFVNMPAMLDDGKVDLINLILLFRHDIENGKYRTLFTGRDARGPSQAELWAMRSDFIAAHRASVVDFFEDHIRAVRWFLDAANREEALAIAHAVTKAPLKNLDYLFTTADSYRSPDASPDIEAVQREIDEQVKLGVVPKRVEVMPTHVDLSLIEEAKRRIDGK